MHRSLFSVPVVLLALAPMLMAPTCVQKSVYPTACATGSSGCVTPESKLEETQSNAVLALGLTNWNAIEVCNLCPASGCVAKTGYTTHANCSGTTSCQCKYDTSGLDAYLNAYVPASSAHGTRNFMIQLAPIFTAQRTTPLYLTNVAWNTPTMKNAYHAVLDKVLAVIATKMVSTGANNTPVSPLVAIEFGNEVNEYLNAQADPIGAWDQYIDFVKDAKAYVDGKVGYTFETVSTTWVGNCGIGNWLRLGGSNNPCDAKANKVFEMMKAMNLMTYTYYPQSVLPAPSASQLQSTVATDFAYIAYFAQAAQMVAMLQEVGYPSPYPGTATQNDFVNDVYAEWAKYYDQIKGVGYFTLHDFTIGTTMYTWGLYNQNGTVKNQSTWNNFAAKMQAVPLQ